MLKILSITLAAGALMAASAVAQDTPAPAPSAAEEGSGADTGSDLDKVVCKLVKPPTGTRVGSSRSRQKICMTKRQWDEQAAEAQETLKMRDRGICSDRSCSG